MDNDINIRTALYDDIPLIHAMAEVVFRQTYARILSPEQMEFMMDWMYSEENLREQMDSGHQYFLAFVSGSPAGYASVQPDGYISDRPDAPAPAKSGGLSSAQTDVPAALSDGLGGEVRALFHLQKLYVMPEFQGQGLGLRLFDRVVSSVAPSAPCSIELNVNRSNPAVTFYEHIGMRRLRQGDFPIGHGFYMNDYIMGLDIDR